MNIYQIFKVQLSCTILNDKPTDEFWINSSYKYRQDSTRDLNCYLKKNQLKMFRYSAFHLILKAQKSLTTTKIDNAIKEYQRQVCWLI